MITKKYYKLVRVSYSDSEYFRVTNISNEAGEFSIKNYSSGTMEYSLDGITWNSYDLSTKPTVQVNPSSNIYLRGTGFTNTISNDPVIDFNKNYTIGGNFMSLSNYATMDSVSIINSSNYILYAFNNQTNLVSAGDMNFGIITRIETSGCYNMFQGCTSLTTAPDMSSVTSIEGCRNMFKGCTSLTTAPDLSNVTLIEYQSCDSMFQGCTSLTTVPDLSSLTTVYSSGCNNMFRGCTSLTTAPDLSSLTSVYSSSCSNMFNGCTNLSSVTAPNIDTWNTSNFSNWLLSAGTQATGTKTFYKPTNLTIPTDNNSGVPSGWTVENY